MYHCCCCCSSRNSFAAHWYDCLDDKIVAIVDIVSPRYWHGICTIRNSVVVIVAIVPVSEYFSSASFGQLTLIENRAVHLLPLLFRILVLFVPLAAAAAAAAAAILEICDIRAVDSVPKCRVQDIGHHCLVLDNDHVSDGTDAIARTVHSRNVH